MKTFQTMQAVHVLTASGLEVLTSTTDRAAAKLLHQVERFGLQQLTAKEATAKVKAGAKRVKISDMY